MDQATGLAMPACSAGQHSSRKLAITSIASFRLVLFIFNIIATWCVTMVVKCLNDDGRDMTEVPKCFLDAVLYYLFYFYQCQVCIS